MCSLLISNYKKDYFFVREKSPLIYSIYNKNISSKRRVKLIRIISSKIKLVNKNIKGYYKINVLNIVKLVALKKDYVIYYHCI